MAAQYALITGASSGIGLELARIAAANHYNLILLARNAEKLMELRTELESAHPVKVLAVGCDLSKYDTVKKIAALLAERHIVPDILINNAGFGLYGAFDQTDAYTEMNMIRVNIIALTELSKIIYKQMLQRGSGRILNVSSVAGFMPGPLMAVYYATKAYVLSFSEALAKEAEGSGVSVTTLCPGPTATGFETNASAEESMLFKRFGKVPTGKEVAEYGWRSMMKGKTTAVHGFKNRWMLFFIRLLPRKTVAGMVKKVQAPAGK